MQWQCKKSFAEYVAEHMCKHHVHSNTKLCNQQRTLAMSRPLMHVVVLSFAAAVAAAFSVLAALLQGQDWAVWLLSGFLWQQED